MRATLHATLRMRRLPIALLPWMVLATAAQAQTRSADVLYTHHDDVPTRALRVGDEAFVAIDDVKRWGWTTNVWADFVDIKAEGITASVPYRVFSGRQMLPLRATLKKLGGGTEWVNNTDTLTVFGAVKYVSVRAGKVYADASMEFRPRVSVLTDPNRVVVDLTGVRLDGATKLDLDSTARVSQYRPNVTRIVFQTPAAIDLDKLNFQPGRTLEADWSAPPVEPTKPDEQTTVPPVTTVDNPPVVPPTVPAVVPKLVVQVRSENDSQLWIDIPVTTTAEPTFQKPDVDTLEIVLPGVFRDLEDGFMVESPSIMAATTRKIASGTVLTLALARPLGAQIIRDSTGVHLQLVKPDVGDGRLAGKLVVVDPGHGGKDKGASAGGVFEKDLNLTMGRLIAEALAKEGATVVMTRKTDVFISLDARAEMAQKIHADMFVSTHINSTGNSSNQSGGITFHHFGRPVSKVLAECIQQEIGKVSGIPNLGVWSDQRIYRTGFAVLRQTTMPGVLLELGFINNARDRKRLVTDDFQRSVAAAVVRGIKVFLGDAKKND